MAGRKHRRFFCQLLSSSELNLGVTEGSANTGIDAAVAVLIEQSLELQRNGDIGSVKGLYSVPALISQIDPIKIRVDRIYA